MNFSLRNITISALSLTPDFLLDQRMFAATDQGLWTSKNGGNTWENAFSSMANLDPFAVTSVVAVKGKMGENVVLAGVSGGFLRSDDDAQTWNYIQLPPPQPLVTSLAVSQNKVLFAGTAQDGVFLSKDEGKTWARWSFGLLDWHIYSLSATAWPDGSQTVFAGAETGVFYSINQGRTWRETDFPIDDGAVISLSASSSLARDLVIAATESSHLYRSLNQGKTWERCDGENFDGEIYSVAAFGSHVLAVCAGKLLYSSDSGLHWAAWAAAHPLPGAVLSLAQFPRSDTERQVFAWLEDGTFQVLDFHL